MGLPGVVLRSLGAVSLWAGTALLSAAWNRLQNETAAAKRARTLARMRIDFELLLNERLSVLKAGEGEAADWCNDATQALWTSVLAPVVRVNAPPLIDLVCHQLVAARLLPSFVTGLQLIALDVGTRAPRLNGIKLAASQPNGTLPGGDVLLDLECELDLDARVEIGATLETGASKLLSRLTRTAQAITARLMLSRIRQGLVLRVRVRPGAAAAFVGLQRFTSKPSAEATLHAADISGLKINLPLHTLPGAETITAWVVQKAMRDLMALPHRFIPLDLQPFVDLLERRTWQAIPPGGSLRVQLREAVGLRALTPHQAEPELLHARSGLDSAGVAFDVDEDDVETPLSLGHTAGADTGRRWHVVAKVTHAFGAKFLKTAPSAESVDSGGALRWGGHEANMVVGLVAPADAITVTLRRRGVPGRGGRLGSGHFKLYWAPDGTATVFFASHEGDPVVLRLCASEARDAPRLAAGVLFSGRDNVASFWLPLQGAPGGAPAAVCIALRCDWHQSPHALPPREQLAAAVLQRAVRRWKARQRLAKERALLHGVSGIRADFHPGALELCVTLARFRGLPLKSQYRVTLDCIATVHLGPGAAAIAFSPVLHTPPHAAAACDPAFGQTLRIAAPAPQDGGMAALWAAAPSLHVQLYRKGVLLCGGTLDIPASYAQSRGTVKAVWVKVQGPGLKELAARSLHKLALSHPATGLQHEQPPPAALLYISVVPRAGAFGAASAPLRKVSHPREAPTEAHSQLAPEWAPAPALEAVEALLPPTPAELLAEQALQRERAEEAARDEQARAAAKAAERARADEAARAKVARAAAAIADRKAAEAARAEAAEKALAARAAERARTDEVNRERMTRAAAAIAERKRAETEARQAAEEARLTAEARKAAEARQAAEEDERQAKAAEEARRLRVEADAPTPVVAESAPEEDAGEPAEMAAPALRTADEMTPGEREWADLFARLAALDRATAEHKFTDLPVGDAPPLASGEDVAVEEPPPPAPPLARVSEPFVPHSSGVTSDAAPFELQAKPAEATRPRKWAQPPPVQRVPAGPIEWKVAAPPPLI